MEFLVIVLNPFVYLRERERVRLSDFRQLARAQNSTNQALMSQSRERVWYIQLRDGS